MDVCNEAGSGLEQVVERSLTPPNTRRSFKPVLYREYWKCYLEVEVEELDTLAQDINDLKYSAQVAFILDSNEPSISKGMAQLGLEDNGLLAERLDRYNANQPDGLTGTTPTSRTWPPSPTSLHFH
ncbi:uncharacterized protein [Apostichopus japonicus]|uniref:uncharacterized protein n=1 Tax=Stichopus japonicus TaxID=307972 RepID=UPI003AB244CE